MPLFILVLALFLAFPAEPMAQDVDKGVAPAPAQEKAPGKEEAGPVRERKPIKSVSPCHSDNPPAWCKKN